MNLYRCGRWASYLVAKDDSDELGWQRWDHLNAIVSTEIRDVNDDDDDDDDFPPLTHGGRMRVLLGEMRCALVVDCSIAVDRAGFVQVGPSRGRGVGVE